MACYGLDASFKHFENGMQLKDMQAAAAVATRLNEVIIFRSTGPWSKRWIELGYPTKNFHVKGKSSDWGPQAGFVPHNGIFSKVGGDPKKAGEGSKKNLEGLDHKFAGTTQLVLTEAELQMQLTLRAEKSGRTAIDRMMPVSGSNNKFLVAKRSGDKKEFAFLAVYDGRAGHYRIESFDERLGANPFKLIGKQGTPLLMMTSSEVGANNRPMTGDYDLMAVCPTWADLNSRTLTAISKPGLNFEGKGLQAQASFASGSVMDRVLDMRTMTGARLKNDKNPAKNELLGGAAGTREHADMGNLTPRILRCINELNAAMGATGSASAGRRVHHNAESHRNAMFGALTASDMEGGDGLPLTVFQPSRLTGGASPVARYSAVATLETLGEFKQYAAHLHEAGYFVPKNWTWGMSIRNTANQNFGHLRS